MVLDRSQKATVGPNFEVYGSRLMDPLVAMLTELRDSIEVVHTAEYVKFLAFVLPGFLNILNTVVVSTNLNSNEHKIRNIVLEIIHRFPYNDALKQYAPDLMETLIRVLELDYEENAVICIKIIVDLHKNYTASMEKFVIPFLETVKGMYINMPDAVKTSFAQASNPKQKKEMAKATSSFKVLTECPIIVALLFQLHRNLVTNSVPMFVEPIIRVLSLQAPQQLKEHNDATARGTIFVGMSPSILDPALYAVFKSMQVKTLSFLAYILRSFLPILMQYQDQIADGVITLMKDCPEEASVTRKELLVAARHLWYTDFRKPFVKYIDLLLNDEILIGTGVTCKETLKPLAHSILIDLLYNLRSQISSSQWAKIIPVFARDLEDPSFPPNIQTMCVKLFMGLSDTLAIQPNTLESRQFAIQTLEVFALRLASLKDTFSTILNYHNSNNTDNPDKDSAEMLTLDSFIDIGNAQPIRTTPKPYEGSTDLVKDMKFQFKSILNSIKSTLVALRNIDSASPSKATQPAHFAEQCGILIRIFRDGLNCFEYYFIDPETKDKQVAQKDDKEVVEAFASIFTFVDLTIFQETCCTQLPYLFERVLTNPFILAIPQYFLANNAISANFSGPLLKFLMERFEDIGGKDSNKATVILRLFKLLFMALSLFPELNERVFQPHLANIIISSLKVSGKTSEPLNYFLLLRGLFRSIGGGKFENLYQEVLPLLQVLLESLNSLLSSSHIPQMRELFVELCLTVPVRLSVLLPHLSYLMRPLVIALQAGPELVSQSLKTLELCIDNLNQEFLEPIFAPVKEELMMALWQHIKPAPYNHVHSTTALRILGKFGGRNRKSINELSALKTKVPRHAELGLVVTLAGSTEEQVLVLEEALESAALILNNPPPSNSQTSVIQIYGHQLNDAFSFIKSCAPLIFDVDAFTGGLEGNIYGLIEAFHAHVEALDRNSDSMRIDTEASLFPEAPDRSLDGRQNFEKIVCNWLCSVFAAASHAELSELAWQLIENICRHFALIAIDESMKTPAPDKSTNRPSLELLNNSALSNLNGFIDALTNTIGDEKQVKRETAVRVLTTFADSVTGLLGSAVVSEKVFVFQTIGLRFSSLCYQREWYKKMGGSMGISTLCLKLGFSVSWILAFELEFVKAILFVLKDTEQDIPYFDISVTVETMNHILKVCNSPDVSDPTRENRFNSLVSVLISELSNSNRLVRVTVQSSLSLLAELAGKTVTSILEPVGDRLLFPIFAKPLRALPFAMQIGYIEAINYCLSLTPPLITFSDELGRLLQEALALADAEDQAISGKENQYKSATILNNLRVECIKLLSAVINALDFSSPRMAPIKNRILTLFFKCLYSKCPEVIEVANKGLSEFMGQQQRLPKDLLQAGLKPILVNLSDYKKLSVAGLEGLARLLKLLTNYFKVEIGRKLLDHLRKWADPMVLQELSTKPLADSEVMSVIVAILNVFYLLPPAANCFLNELVLQVLELEAIVCRSASSPFRLPLVRFVNRYADESVNYFLEKMSDESFVLLFCSLLKSEEAVDLRENLLKKTVEIKALVKKVLPMNDKTSTTYVHNIVQLLAVINELDKEWLLENGETFRICLIISNTIGSLNVEPYVKHRVKYTIDLILISVMELQGDTVNMEYLFELVNVFLDKDLMDINFAKHHIFKVASKGSNTFKKIILNQYLEWYDDTNVNVVFKATALRYLVIPILMATTENVTEIYDLDVINRILNSIWIAPINVGTNAQKDALKLELIQLTTLMLYQTPDSLNECLKDLIKFAWSHLKIEDTSVKQAAYVLVCRFIKEYETPTKIVAQTYVAQLRAHQIEIRPMVKQGLDSIIPVLSNRAGMGPSETGGVPVWIQWIRKTIIEDGHSVSQLVSVYQLIIRNPGEFFGSCEHFLPQIVSSLARLGLSANATSETKSISLDLAELLWKWETKAKSLHEDGMEVDGETPGTAIPLENYKEIILAFLLRFSLSLTDPTLNKVLFSKSIDLFQKFLVLWPNVAVTLVQLLKVASMEISDANLAFMLNAAEILKALVSTKSSSWLRENLNLFQNCLDKWSNNTSPQFISATSSIIDKVSIALEEETEDSSKYLAGKVQFFKTIDAKLHERIKAGTNMASLHVLLKEYYLPRVSKPAMATSLRAHLTDLVPFLQNVLNEYIAANNSTEVAPTSLVQPEYIEAIVQVLSSQILYLGDLRKSYLQILGQIIESKECTALHKNVLQLVRKWTLAPNQEAFPTIKEKSTLAAKMVLFETFVDKDDKAQNLFEEYMELVADIYEEESLARTELTVRLEGVFLMGTKLSNTLIRKRFLNILDRSIPESIQARMKYVLGVQNWQSLSSSFWINQAVDMVLGSIICEQKIYTSHRSKRIPFINLREFTRTMNVEFVTDFVSKEDQFLTSIKECPVDAMIRAIRSLVHSNISLSYSMWTLMFEISWNCFSGVERHDLTKCLIILLAKEYHIVQASVRPNVIQVLLEGAAAANPSIQLPPQLLKYLGKTYNAWYTSIEFLEKCVTDDIFNSGNSNKDEEKIRESFLDALADLYADLNENDYFAGLWRRRCLFAETNAAVSFEQCGLWQHAQKFYENAQAKARTCVLPFTESEYVLWEKQWIQCTEKLEQWDILCDLSKHESNPELLLECAWRLSDWNADRDSLNMTLQSVAQPATPRKKFFQAFLVLNRLNDGQESVADFQAVCEEGIQLVLKRWHALPSIVSNSHIPTFHAFQQFVEIHEAYQIQNNLLGTNAANIDLKSQELKNILSTWRDRMPNTWDDMTIWSDLVAWRQHVFTAINTAYLPLIPHINSTVGSPTSSYAYRGYHETAWIINRFAHVARKHRLPNVCISQLGKIYTLPNIEIQEAFYKLREQAKCHKDVLGEYSAALDVINNTNLLYFNSSQKAEFFNLRGTFLAKLNLNDEAHQAFSSAIQVEPNLAHSWASFGEFNDKLFEQNPEEMKYAAEALNCYLHASALLNNGRCRKLLSRILWLLSLDDEGSTLMKVYEAHKAETPIWYWVTFIPELIGSLSGSEARFALVILMKIANSFPQALHFQLRTAKEDVAHLRKKLDGQGASATTSEPAEEPKNNAESTSMSKSESDKKEDQTGENAESQSMAQNNSNPWESIEQIMSRLKTAYPLLALTMETMVDQVLVRLKPTADEDIYRLIVALLNDGVQMYIGNLHKDPDSGGPLSAATEASLLRFAESMTPNHVKYKEAFERDFITSKPNLAQLVERFRIWKHHLENLLDSRPQHFYMERFSQYLVEFEYSKFDDIEIPGQYLNLKSSNKDFARIDRFNPVIELFRGHGGCHKRIVINGHDGSVNPFIIQHPAAKHCRREERTLHLFRLLNSTLERKIETRRRNLHFCIPAVIPLAPQIRLVQEDRSNVSLQDIFEDHALVNGFRRDDAIIYYTERLKEACKREDLSQKTKVEIVGLKEEINAEIAQKMIPETILSKYLYEKMNSYEDLWVLRKRFTCQMACVTFMTYLLSIGQRYPQKFYISLERGTIWMPEFFASISQQNFLFTSSEAVPFRFTPNLQNFMTPIGVEGVFTSSLASIADVLGNSNLDMQNFLALFIRDELLTWQNVIRKPNAANTNRLRELVTQNIKLCMHRAQVLSCNTEREVAAERSEPLYQSILDLISQATNPLKLAQMDISFLPQL